MEAESLLYDPNIINTMIVSLWKKWRERDHIVASYTHLLLVNKEKKVECRTK